MKSIIFKKSDNTVQEDVFPWYNKIGSMKVLLKLFERENRKKLDQANPENNKNIEKGSAYITPECTGSSQDRQEWRLTFGQTL